MDYLKNHCWCSSSHWDNNFFDCQIIVSLSSYREGYKEDWDDLTHKVEVFSQEKLDDYQESIARLMEKYPAADYSNVLNNRIGGMVKINKLRPEVLEWLESNISDYGVGKGWCVGSDSYDVGGSTSSLSVFMQRRGDAMKFIKRWSKWKKPIHYCQYFTDVRKSLDLDTLKYNK
jgi:hypothetical protein